MATFLERYLNGEHEQVWDALQAYGPAIRSEPLLGEAIAVTRELMQRVRANIELLITRLQAIQYEFKHSLQPAEDLSELAVHIPPTPVLQEHVRLLTQYAGPLPLAIQIWYEIVGAVILEGRHPRLNPPLEPVARKQTTVGELWLFTPEQLATREKAEPLVIYPIERYHLQDAAAWRGLQNKEPAHEKRPFSLEIAPERIVYGVQLPNETLDAPWYNEHDETTFVSYLRTALRWGGFRGIERWPEAEQPMDLIAYLTQDFQPF